MKRWFVGLCLFAFYIGGNAIDLMVFPFYCSANDSIQNQQISQLLHQSLQKKFVTTASSDSLPTTFYTTLFSSFKPLDISIPLAHSSISKIQYALIPAATKIDHFYFFHFSLVDVDRQKIVHLWRQEGEVTQFPKLFQQLTDNITTYFQQINYFPSSTRNPILTIQSTQPNVIPIAKIEIPDYQFTAYTDEKGQCSLPPFTDYWPHAVIAIGISGEEVAAKFMDYNQWSPTLLLPVFSDNIQMLDQKLHHLGDNLNDQKIFLTRAEGNTFTMSFNTRFFVHQETASMELFSCFSGLDEGANIFINGKKICHVQLDGPFHFSFPATFLEEMAENTLEIQSINGDDFQFATFRYRINP